MQLNPQQHKYSIKLLYAPFDYDESKYKNVRVIGSFNEWQENNCLFDESLGMYYFNYATDDLYNTKIEFTFKAADCHVVCSEIYPLVQNPFGSHNNFLDFEKLHAEV